MVNSITIGDVVMKDVDFEKVLVAKSINPLHDKMTTGLKM